MAVPAVTKVTTRITPFKSFVLQADPDFEAAKRREPFYEFTNRTFVGNNSTMGPYNPNPND
jgi:hypothetical protein